LLPSDAHPPVPSTLNQQRGGGLRRKPFGCLADQNEAMAHALLFLVVALPAAYVVVEGLRLLQAPEQWPSSTNRWLVSLRWARDPRPTNAELRFWGAVWTLLGLVFIGIALAAVLAG
jgi:hypothetical protein